MGKALERLWRGRKVLRAWKAALNGKLKGEALLIEFPRNFQTLNETN